MADAWGGSWGVAWGSSWGVGGETPVTPPNDYINPRSGGGAGSGIGGMASASIDWDAREDILAIARETYERITADPRDLPEEDIEAVVEAAPDAVEEKDEGRLPAVDWAAIEADFEALMALYHALIEIDVRREEEDIATLLSGMHRAAARIILDQMRIK